MPIQNRELPNDQEKLLRDLNDIDTLERLDILPEKNNLNLIITGLIWTFAIIFAISKISAGNSNFLIKIITACGILSLGLIGSYSGKRWGDYLSATSIVLINIYLTLTQQGYHSDFILLIDAITILIFSNQFNLKGFLFSTFLTLTKLISIFFLFRDGSIETLASNIVMIALAGSIPVFVRAMSEFSRSAKKQEIRAAILALQNQDLLESWQKSSSKVNTNTYSIPTENTASPQDGSQDIPTDEQIYQSPYKPN